MAAPAAIDTGEAGENVPALEVVVKVTVTALAASTGLPKESSNARLIVLDGTSAVSVCGVVVKTRWLAAAGTTVSCCVAPTNCCPSAGLTLIAVSTGVPAELSV